LVVTALPVAVVRGGQWRCFSTRMKKRGYLEVMVVSGRFRCVIEAC
jgi:hypothetical protein